MYFVLPPTAIKSLILKTISELFIAILHDGRLNSQINALLHSLCAKANLSFGENHRAISMIEN